MLTWRVEACAKYQKVKSSLLTKRTGGNIGRDLIFCLELVSGCRALGDAVTSGDCRGVIVAAHESQQRRNLTVLSRVQLWLLTHIPEKIFVNFL